MGNDIVTEPRSSLYYGQYQYSITWHQLEIGCIRTLDEEAMHKAMQMRAQFSKLLHGNVAGESKLTVRCRSNLESIRSLLTAEASPVKLICYTDWATVYTNDLSLKQRLEACDWIESVAVKQANAVLPPDTVFLEDPQHGYRTYFRSQKLTEPQVEHFSTWVSNQGADIRISKSLAAFLRPQERRPWKNWRSWHTQTHFFVDHNSLQYTTMIAMLVPGLVRKTVKLAKKP